MTNRRTRSARGSCSSNRPSSPSTNTWTSPTMRGRLLFASLLFIQDRLDLPLIEYGSILCWVYLPPVVQCESRVQRAPQHTDGHRRAGGPPLVEEHPRARHAHRLASLPGTFCLPAAFHVILFTVSMLNMKYFVF